MFLSKPGSTGTTFINKQEGFGSLLNSDFGHIIHRNLDSVQFVFFLSLSLTGCGQQQFDWLSSEVTRLVQLWRGLIRLQRPTS